MATAQAALELTRRLAKAVRTLKMYGVEHVQTQADADAFLTALQKTLAEDRRVHFVIQGTALLVQDVLQPSKDSPVAFLTDSLRNRQITSVSFEGGVERAEILRLAGILIAKPDEVASGKELHPAILQGLVRVRLNEIRFVAVSAGESVTSTTVSTTSETAIMPATPGPEGGPGGTRFMDTRREAPPPAGGGPGVLPAPVVDGVVVPAEFRDLVPLLEGMVRQGGGEDARRKLADFLSRSAAPTPGQSLGDRIRQIMDRIPESMRGQLQTPALRADLSAALVAREVESATDDGSLLKTFEELAPEVGGAMGLLDAVTRALQTTGHAASVDALERAMRLIPTLDTIEEMLFGNVLVAIANVDRRAAAIQALSGRGYEVDFVLTAKDAVELALVRGRYDCVVLEMELPDQNGQFVLSRLQRAKVGVPVVVVSPRAESYKFDFDVMSYPTKAFVASADPRVLVDAVKAIATPRLRTPDASDREEKQRAREIQSRLVPKEMPRLPGFEAAFAYRPAGVVGGDYIDAFAIDSDRIGFVIADVSGKGFPAAMVMVMVRSAFRLAAIGIVSPRDAVKRVNALVTPDMRQGMFITVCYAILEQSTGRVTMATCAHNPPFIFDPREGKARRLAGGGMPLGLTAPERFDAAVVEEEIVLPPGGHLVLYTDGVTEAMNETQVEFGEDATSNVIESAGNGTPAQMVDALLAALVMHRAGAKPSDDITILDLRSTATASVDALRDLEG